MPPPVPPPLLPAAGGCAGSRKQTTASPHSDASEVRGPCIGWEDGSQEGASSVPWRPGRSGDKLASKEADLNPNSQLGYWATLYLCSALPLELDETPLLSAASQPNCSSVKFDKRN